MVLRDMSEYYETVGRERLRKQHEQTGFPAPVADLSLSQYGGKRILQLGQAAEACGYPTVGIQPGCTAATYHVQAHSGPGVSEIAENNPEVATNVHIDDFCTSAVGRTEQRSSRGWHRRQQTS